jgi:lysophospholipase L1-like esterase
MRLGRLGHSNRIAVARPVKDKAIVVEADERMADFALSLKFSGHLVSDEQNCWTLSKLGGAGEAYPALLHPAPPPPVAERHAQLLLFGTAISANCDQSAQNQAPCEDHCNSNLSGSFGYWLGLYAGDRVARFSAGDCYRTNNFSTPGASISDMATPERLAPVLARIVPGRTVVVHQAGDNDLLSDRAHVIAMLRRIWTALLDAGAIVVFPTIFPRGGEHVLAPPLIDFARQINDEAHAFAHTDGWRGFAVADLDTIMVDRSRPGWVAREGYLQDGIHPSVVGGSAIAWEIARQIRRLVPRVVTRSDVDTVYDAVSQPDGNLLVNGSLRGEGGVLRGTARGASPSHWELDASRAGGVVVFAMEVPQGDRDVLALTISGASTGGEIWLTQTLQQPPGIVAGDVLRAQMRVSLGRNRNLVGLSLRLASFEEGVWRYCLGGAPHGNSPLPPEGFATGDAFVAISAPDRRLSAPPSELAVSLIIRMPDLEEPVPVSAIIQIENAELRKIGGRPQPEPPAKIEPPERRSKRRLRPHRQATAEDRSPQ